MASEKYQALKVISRGTWGVVTQCRCAGGEVVALKMFEDAVKNDLVCKVAVREAKVLKQLSHPHIVKLLDVYRTTLNLYLVFEYVEFTLLDIIQQHRYGAPEEQVKDLMHQLGTALEFMHSRKIIHRDLKPENVLVTKGGTLKLCDFGFARPVPEMEGAFTAYVSTRWYRSPELLLGERYGAASDIWSFGCIMAEMLTGKPLFPGSTDLDQLHLIAVMIGLSSRQSDLMRRRHGADKTGEEEAGQGASRLDRRLAKVAAPGVELITACLQPDPKHRPTIAQLMASAFFKGVNPTRRVALDGQPGSPIHPLHAALGALPRRDAQGTIDSARPSEARHSLNSASLHECSQDAAAATMVRPVPAATVLAVAPKTHKIVTSILQPDRKQS